MKTLRVDFESRDELDRLWFTDPTSKASYDTEKPNVGEQVLLTDGEVIVSAKVSKLKTGIAARLDWRTVQFASLRRKAG